MRTSSGSCSSPTTLLPWNYMPRQPRSAHQFIRAGTWPASAISAAAEIADLARVLKTVLAKLYHGLGNPDFNFTIRSAPAEYVGVKHFHWYVSIIPRLTRVAGFELGSGMFINTVLAGSGGGVLAECEGGNGCRERVNHRLSKSPGHPHCHSEERSDEKSGHRRRRGKSRSLALLGMTVGSNDVVWPRITLHHGLLLHPRVRRCAQGFHPARGSRVSADFNIGS